MGPGLWDDSAKGNAMSNTEKSAGIFGGPSAAEREQLLQQFYGKRLLSSAGAGAGIGLGAAALYHLLRGMKPEGKKEKKYPSYGSGTPMIAKAASFAPPSQNPTGFLTQTNKTTDIRDMLGLPKGRTSMGGPAGHTLNPTSPSNRMPLSIDPGKVKDMWSQYFQKYGPGGQQPGMLGAGGGIVPQQQTNPGINGGVNNAPQQPFGFVNGMPGTGQGGLMGGGGPYSMKVGFDLNSLSESVGKTLPTTMVPFGAPNVPGRGAAPSADPHPWRKSWSTAANIGGAALGTYAGAKLINSLVKAKKKRDRESALEAARAEYYNALSGKSASALDVAFERVKKANMLSTTASALWNTPQTLRTAYLLTLLGAGGLGAKYMYDRTKNLTEGENLAKAQASRARTKGLPPVWVDPESLAHIKSTAESDE